MSVTYGPLTATISLLRSDTVAMRDVNYAERNLSPAIYIKQMHRFARLNKLARLQC